MQIDNINNTNFTGIHILNTKCFLQDDKIAYLRMYELKRKDTSFLQHMYNSIKLEKFVPDIPKQKMEVWYLILKGAIEFSSDKKYKSYLVTKDSKPCGIMTFKPNSNKYEISWACTWPIEKGKKVPLAGTTLFKTVFEDFLKSKATVINVDAIKKVGPYETINKYLQLGFKPVGGEYFFETMQATRSDVIQTLKKLNTMIVSKPTNRTLNLNLFEELVV